MRRMNGRNPNFIVVGLTFVVFLLVYKCWTLSSQNDDLSKEIDKFQTELKISGLKQDQFDKKNQKLQGSIHDLDEKQQKLKSQIDEEEHQLQEALNNIKSKEYEITSLKNKLLKLQEHEKDLKQQLEDKDNKIEELTSDSQHILTLKNDAEEALSEKDNQINDLKREVEKAKSVAAEFEARLSKVKEDYNKLLKQIRQAESEKAPVIPQGPNNNAKGSSKAPVKVEKEVNKNQIQEPDSINNLADQIRRGSFISGGDHVNNVIQNPSLVDNSPSDPNETHMSGVIEKPQNKPVPGEGPIQDIGNPVLQQPQLQQHDTRNVVLQEPSHQDENQEKRVLMPPPNKEENLDAAIDDDAKAVEDPSDDQDEEGKEIKKDLENNAADNYENYDDDKVDNPHLIKDELNNNNRHEPQGIGAMEIPRHEKRRKEGKINEAIDDVNLEDDVDQRANERVYEGNFDNKIRNLGRL